MDKQKDIQAILDLLADYVNKYDIEDKKYKDAYNSILALTTVTPATTKTTKTKNDKKDIYDTWTGIIKNGMTTL